MLEQIFIKDTEDNVEVISSGENFFIEIRLRKDENLTGAALLARNDKTGEALSDTQLKGTNEAIQRVDLIDLDLEANTFHKINVLVENLDSLQAANGDGISLINVVYLFMIETVDQNE